ncbi:MAG: AgmX/PglI C-terminal domain-containing protein [Polyangiaceae bacterium]
MSSSPLSPFASSSNPFAALRAEDESPVSGRGAYELIASGPAVDASEVEASESAVEVIVRWADSVLTIQHLAPARSFFVGEEGCDHVIPADKLGTVRAPIVLVENGEVFAVVLAASTSKIVVGGRTLSLADATTEKLAIPCADGSPDTKIKLATGTRVRTEIGGFVFEVAGVKAARKVAGKGHGDSKAYGAQAVSLLLHGAVAASLFAFMPALASTEDGSMSNETKHQLQIALQAAAREEIEEQKLVSDQAPDAAAQQGADAGSPAMGTPGMMGKETATKTNGQYGIKGSAEVRTLSRKEMLQSAESFGMIGVLATADSGRNTPDSPWGDAANGPDAFDASGNLYGAELGDSYGHGGLDVSGTGDGAGGLGFGVGVGNLSTVGHAGGCIGANCGTGIGTNTMRGTHATGSPRIRPAPPSVSGRIPGEVIQRIVRQNFGRFRACYEAGLRNNPNLQGRVTVGFVIGADGAVGSVNNAGSDLPDAGVVSCVVGSFRGLSFSAPEGGIVKVSYPIVFTPN